MTSRNRKTITINLVRGKDDDLLRWIERIPNQGRNAALKFALRAGLELPQPVHETAPAERLENIAGELETLKTAFARLPNLIRQQPGSDPRLDDLQRAVDDFRQWAGTIQNRIDQISSGIVEMPAPIIDIAPELSEGEKQQRASKLKKAKW